MNNGDAATQAQAAAVAGEGPNSALWTESFVAMDRLGWLHHLRRSSQLNIFERYIQDPDAVILDVGCGSGTFLNQLLEAGFSKVYGVEPNPALVEAFARFRPAEAHRVQHGHGEHLPFPDASFDAICFLNVLHHLVGEDAYRKTLNEARRCLRPGGIIILVEPCRLWIYLTARIVARLLSPFASVFRHIFVITSEEKELLTFFIAHIPWIRDFFVARQDHLLRDRLWLHQWILVVRRAP